MSFEVIIHYYPRSSDGNGWSYDDPQQTKKKIGKPFDDSDYAKLAALCISEHARRDVLVYDIEAYELVKKKMQVKAATDSRGGVIIKGKRYKLDSLAGTPEPDCETDTSDDIGTDNQNLPVLEVQNQAPPPQPKNDYLDLKKMAGQIIPRGTVINHPLLRNEISRDDHFLSRGMMFCPRSPAFQQKYNLVQGKVYQVLARTCSKIMPDNIEKQFTVVMNEKNEIVKVSELDCSTPPAIEEDFLASQSYDPSRITSSQQTDSGQPELANGPMLDIRSR